MSSSWESGTEESNQSELDEGSGIDFDNESSIEYPPLPNSPGAATMHAYSRRYDPLYEFDLMEELLLHGVIPPSGSESPRGVAGVRRFQTGTKLARVAAHPLFRVEFAIRHPDLPWSSSSVSTSVRSLRELERLWSRAPHLVFFGRGGVSSNPSLDISWIERFPDKGWCMHALDGASSSPNFDLSWIERAPDRIALGNFGVSRYSVNIDLGVLEKMEDTMAWGRFGLSANPGLHVSWLKRFPDKRWHWPTVQQHERFSLAWLDAVPTQERLPLLREVPESLTREGPPDLAGCYFLKRVAKTFGSESWPLCVRRRLSKWAVPSSAIGPGAAPLHRHFCLPGSNPALYDRFEIGWVEMFPDTPWVFGTCTEGLSSHRNFDISWVERYPAKPWDFGFGGVSSAPRLRLEWILRMPGAGWSMSGIAGNANFAFGWVPELLRLGVFAPGWASNMRLNNRMHFSEDLEERARRRRRDLRFLAGVCSRGNIRGFLTRRCATFLCRI